MSHQRRYTRRPRNRPDQSKEILLVMDDDQLFCAQIELLASSRFDVYACHDASSINTELLLNAQLIVLDLNMPGVDGIEFIQTIATLAPKPKLLIASGMDRQIIEMARVTAELYGLPVTEIMQKPVGRREFLEKLSLLDNKHKLNEPPISGRTLQKSSEGQIASGMNAGEFLTYYQPQLDFNSKAVVGIEALARWDHPEFGILPPANFIEAVETSTLCMDFTLLIIESAMSDYQQLSRRTGFTGTLSVNVPPMAFEIGNLPDQIFEIAGRAEFPLHKLVCEITEHGVENMGPATLASLARLKMHGVQLSIDDFGTGQSGLSKLRTGAFNELKIDRSFIRDMTSTRNSLLIVDSIMELSSQFGLRVVAEGIEDEETLTALSELGRPVLQGFLFSKPLSLRELSVWMNNWLRKNDIDSFSNTMATLNALEHAS
jgi:EAL domain-containing protein (putative c-di-GMP-specific phosphodiesterase class I)/ActR/RegA family two-component response regulator